MIRFQNRLRRLEQARARAGCRRCAVLRDTPVFLDHDHRPLAAQEVLVCPACGANHNARKVYVGLDPTRI